MDNVGRIKYPCIYTHTLLLKRSSLSFSLLLGGVRGVARSECSSRVLQIMNIRPDDMVGRNKFTTCQRHQM